MPPGAPKNASFLGWTCDPAHPVQKKPRFVIKTNERFNDGTIGTMISFCALGAFLFYRSYRSIVKSLNSSCSGMGFVVNFSLELC